MSVIRVPKTWKYFISISIFLLLAIGCSAPNAATPTNLVNEQVQIETSSAPLTTATPFPSKTPATGTTLEPSMTPTITLSSSTTVESAGENTATEEKKTYPQLPPADLYANPDDYEGKRFMVDGVVLGYGYRKFEGKDVYIIQVGVIDYPRPIIVLGFLPNPKLGIHDGIIIGGTGRGAYYGVDPNDPMIFTPVIFGEWYECNLLWDQWKYPYEFWTLNQLEPATVN